MAKKAPANKVETKAPARSAAKPKPTTEPVRNTAIPKTKPAAKPALTHEIIAQRAYFIAISGTGGSEYDNWCRAEAELKQELGL